MKNIIHFKLVIASVLFLSFFTSNSLTLAQVASASNPSSGVVNNGVAPLTDVLELMLRLNMVGPAQTEKARALGVLLEKVNVNGVFVLSGQSVTKVLASTSNNTTFSLSGLFAGVGIGDFVLDYTTNEKTSFYDFIDLLSTPGVIKSDKVRQAKALAVLTGNPTFQGKIRIIKRSTPSSSSNTSSNNNSNSNSNSSNSVSYYGNLLGNSNTPCVSTGQVPSSFNTGNAGTCYSTYPSSNKTNSAGGIYLRQER
ncbi:MAG: hypothetical protein WCJ59_00180 [bacterium]